MPVDIRKVQDEAGEEMVDLVKKAGVVLSKKKINPALDQAAVIATFDHSSSTEEKYRLYSSGRMQSVADLVFAAGLQFDDDGEVPTSLFDDHVTPLGEITLRNCRGFLQREHKRYRYGGTDYLSALRWIVAEAGYGGVDLGSLPHNPLWQPSQTRRHWWGGRVHEAETAHESTLRLRASARYPTFAVFVTDGEPMDPKDAIVEYLTLMSQLPIFVQFIGVGAPRFEFLEQLDTMEGRFVDNANFFNAAEAPTTEAMLEKMLGEFPDYYRKARDLGLITG